MSFKHTSRALGATLLLTGIAATPADLLAQARVAESGKETRFISAINTQTITPALAAVTASHVVGQRPDGPTTLVAIAANGLRFEISLRACIDDGGAGSQSQPRHCRGILMLSSWDAAPASEVDEIGKTVARFLIENPAVNAGLNSDRSPYIARYVIADHGTAHGNLVAEFANFISSATAFQNAIAPFYPD